MPEHVAKLHEIVASLGDAAPDQWDQILLVHGLNERERDQVMEQAIAALAARAREFLDPLPFSEVERDSHGASRPKSVDAATLGSHGSLAGEVIGVYRLLALLGEGGMGVVYKAEQQRPVRRIVALKLIKAGMDTKAVLARFEAERQALAVLDHLNIAKVFDGGRTEQGRPFFVMEYVEGVPMTKYCDDARLSVRERLHLFIPVCQAVQHAHQKGIIHRDLKPSNILVCPYEGRPVPKVIDFGLAKAVRQRLTEQTFHTTRNDLFGTPPYMSPEQADRSGLDIDTRTDIYSLGVILYELLAGTTPLERQRFKDSAWQEMMRLIREQEPPRPSARLGGSATLPGIAAQRNLDPAKLPRLLRGDLDWIVMKALEKERDRRYESASAFADDVQRYLRDEPVRAYPPSVAYRVRKYVRRHKGPVLAAFLVVMALVGGVAGATWGMLRASAAKAVAVREGKQKEVALGHAQERLWWSLYERARAGRLSGQMGQRTESLAAVAEAAAIRPDDRLRNEAIAALALPDVRRIRTGRTLAVGDVVAYGGSRRTYAHATATGVISIREFEGDRLIHEFAAGALAPGCCLYFSPDEGYLIGLFGRGFTLRVWRVADGMPLLRNEPEGCWAHSFSSDGRRLAVGQNDQILSFDLNTGEELKRWRTRGPVNALAFHPKDVRLAVGHAQSNVVSVYDAERGTLFTELAVGTAGAHVVAWHPDGEHLAVSGSDPRIAIWNVAAKRKVASLEGHVKNVTAVPFHPDGDLLASQSWDGVLRLWDPATGRESLKVSLAMTGRPRFGVDGRWPGAGLYGDEAELLEVIPSHEYRTLVSSAGAGRGGYRHYADISPDGRLLLVGMDEGARLWDLPAGKEIAALPAGTPFAFFETRGVSVGSTDTTAILASGSGGLQRWHFDHGSDRDGHRDAGAARTLRPGPPEKLSALRRAWFTRRSDGRVLAVATEEGGANHVLDLETGTVRRAIPAHPSGEVMALSPDGRRAASSGWHSDRVRLWNAQSGELVHEWVVGQRTYVFFTPDSRALIISQGDAYTFYDVETLGLLRRMPRDVRHLPGHVAFSPDGTLMALELAPGVMHLKETESGRTVARLTDPHGDRASWQGFTPDLNRLVVVSQDASAVHIWELQAIRARLRKMNLDRDWSGAAPLTPTDAPDVSP